MRLTVKLVLWFFACVVLAVGINALYGVRGELERYEADVAERHEVTGLVLRAAFNDVMESAGETAAMSMLQYTDKSMRLVDIRWVQLEEAAESERMPHAATARLAPVRAGHDVHEHEGGKLWSYTPVHLEGRPVSALELSETLRRDDVVRRAIVRELRAVGAVAVTIGLAAAVLGLLFVARPIRRLVEHARRIGRGDFSPMTATRGKDEIAVLAREMNAMCVQLSTAEAARTKALDQLQHAERLSTVGKLASGLAHELGTPLGVITLRAKAIAQGRASGDRAREAASTIAEQATRMTNLVRQLLDFARRREPQRAIVDVAKLVRRTTELVEPVAGKARVAFSLDIASTALTVRGDGGQLEQVLTNLLMNAIQAMDDGGKVAIGVRVEHVTPPAYHGGPAAEYVRLVVRDGGRGIDDEALPHIFEPFFTTKDVGEGTGLGLAVCYGIVQDHGGWIDVKTAVREYSEFSVYLPRSAPSLPAPALTTSLAPMEPA